MTGGGFAAALRLARKNAMTPMIRATPTTDTPTPIPACAPLLNPFEVGAAVLVLVAEGAALEDDAWVVGV